MVRHFHLKKKGNLCYVFNRLILSFACVCGEISSDVSMGHIRVVALPKHFNSKPNLNLRKKGGKWTNTMAACYTPQCSVYYVTEAEK